MDVAKQAENVILSLNKDYKGNPYLKTTQIRKFLTAVTSVTNKVNVYKIHHMGEKKFSDALKNEILFLKVKAAYQAGRDRNVKDFVEKSQLFQHIDQAAQSVDDYDEFAHYMEALVAYHKFHGGKD